MTTEMTPNTSLNIAPCLRARDYKDPPCVLIPIVSYGFEPGVAKRCDPERRFYKELAPTIRAEMGDN